MAKSDLGTKRICPTTGKKFYDLNKSPVISPYTGEVVPIAPVAPPRAARGDAARAAAAASATAAADQPEAAEAEELVSLEEADAEENTGKVKAVVPESEDDIEIDETIEGDDDDDSTFIPTRKRATRTSPTSSATSEATKRLEIGPELWFRVMPARRLRRCDSIRGHSSAGRALAWHARGRRFDPAWLHQPSLASRATARQASRALS